MRQLVLGMLIAYGLYKYMSDESTKTSMYSFLHNSEIVEGFSGNVKSKYESDFNNIKFGQMNQEYEEFIKGKIILFDLPLPLDMVSPPPANMSDKTKRELEEISEKMKVLDNDMKDAIKLYDNNLNKIILEFAERENMKYDKDYIEVLLRDVAIIALRLKKIFNRPRPSQLAKYWGIQLHPLKSANIDCPSYPSGVALQAEMVGYILEYMNPNKSAIIKQFVADIAKSRVSAGFNYDSDIKMSATISLILRKYVKYFELKDASKETKAAVKALLKK